MVITFVTVFVANVNMVVEDVTVVSIHVTLHTYNVSYTFRCKQPRAFQYYISHLYQRICTIFILYLYHIISYCII